MAEPESKPEPQPESTDEDYAAAAEALTKKWGETRPCPYCNTNVWLVGPPIRLAHAKQGQLNASPEMCPVSCGNCGNTVFLQKELLLSDTPVQAPPATEDEQT